LPSEKMLWNPSIEDT